MSTEEELLAKIEERARKATMDQLNIAIQAADVSRKNEEFVSMQKRARDAFIGTGVEARAIELSNMSYSEDAYHMLKGFLESEKHIYRKKSGSIQKPVGYDSGGIGAHNNAKKRVPVDITELVEMAGGNIDAVKNIAQPISQLHDNCYLYQTEPDIDLKKYFTHNRVATMNDMNSHAGISILSEIKDAIDKSIERDLRNGYFDAMQIV
ncbi:MAG: hypothetical protein ACRCX2_18550 [Paraclostridium sp.]